MEWLFQHLRYWEEVSEDVEDEDPEAAICSVCKRDFQRHRQVYGWRPNRRRVPAVVVFFATLGVIATALVVLTYAEHLATCH